jgi:hypothetical protein
MYTMPAGQDDTHVPPLQVWPLVHARPHAPQLAVVLSAMHAPPHTVAPLGHDAPHTPPTQVALPFTGAPHAVHDDPHNVTDVSDTQLVPQRCVPLPQTQLPIALHTPLNGDEHAPDVRAEAEHAALPALHTTMPDWAQPPLPLDVHAPPRATQLLPHRLVPVRQTVPQTPAEQLCPDGHVVPQAPQFEASLASSTHAPPHTVAPLGHACPQAPPTHVALPPVGAGHGEHDDPHDVTAVSETQLLPQRCVPLPQTSAAPVSATPESLTVPVSAVGASRVGASSSAASCAGSPASLVAASPVAASDRREDVGSDAQPNARQARAANARSLRRRSRGVTVLFTTLSRREPTTPPPTNAHRGARTRNRPRQIADPTLPVTIDARAWKSPECGEPATRVSPRGVARRE